MDPFQACQYLQTFIGKTSSSGVDLFELLYGLMPLGDELTNPNAPEKVLATASTEAIASTASTGSDGVPAGGIFTRFTPAFPVQISKEALASIFDVSFIAIDVKLLLFHRHWIERLMRVCLSKRLAEVLGRDCPMQSYPPLSTTMSFRFVEKFDLDCYQVVITNDEDRSIISVQSVIRLLPVKPLFVLHWGIRLYDPKAVRAEPVGLMETYIPRIVRLIQNIFKQTVQVLRLLDRVASVRTPRILQHIQSTLVVLESRSANYSASHNEKVKLLRSKLDMYYASPVSRVRAAMDSVVGALTPTQAIDLSKRIAGVVYPSQAINLTKPAGNVNKFNLTSHGEQSLLPQSAGASNSSQVKVLGGTGVAESSPVPKPQSSQEPMTTLTMLNFKLPDIFQALLLAMLTEVYGTILHNYPNRWNPIFEYIFHFFLGQIHPDYSHNASFCLSGSSLPIGLPRLPSFDGVARSISLPTLGPLDSILKPTVPLENISTAGLNNILSAGSSTSAIDPRQSPARLTSFVASRAVSPVILRSVSWSRSCSDSENDAQDTDSKVPELEIKKRKLLPKSPKPTRGQFAAMSLKHNTPVSKPPIEPIQLISKSFNDHSVLTHSREENLSSFERDDSDKEN